MKRIIGIALLVGGIIALVYGLKAKDSIESKVTETFTGRPVTTPSGCLSAARWRRQRG